MESFEFDFRGWNRSKGTSVEWAFQWSLDVRVLLNISIVPNLVTLTPILASAWKKHLGWENSNVFYWFCNHFSIFHTTGTWRGKKAWVLKLVFGLTEEFPMARGLFGLSRLCYLSVSRLFLFLSFFKTNNFEIRRQNERKRPLKTI